MQDNDKRSQAQPQWDLVTGRTRSGKALFECSGCGRLDPAPAKGHECRTRMLVLDPDLADGQHWTVHDTPNAVLIEMIAAWFAEAADGDEIRIKAAFMTAAEVEGLPDI